MLTTLQTILTIFFLLVAFAALDLAVRDFRDHLHRRNAAREQDAAEQVAHEATKQRSAVLLAGEATKRWSAILLAGVEPATHPLPLPVPESKPAHAWPYATADAPKAV